MATEKSISPELVEAQRKFHGPIAEALSLLVVYNQNIDSDSYACLANGVLERITESWDQLEHLMHKCGVLPFEVPEPEVPAD